MTRNASLPYIAPFALFVGILAIHRSLALPDTVVQGGYVVVMTAALFFLSRQVIDFRVTRWAPTIALGVGVFLLWIGPDLLVPGYRDHWLFRNSLTGMSSGGFPEAAKTNHAALWFRGIRAALIVPIVEELFWRAWLMRWLINPNFLAVRLGTWSASAFWITAIAFASEHGAYWEVGLLAGLLYNWWMIRTRSLGDLILAHSVTNGCLSAYVVFAGKWEYWL